ncbi:MAG: hypothetical protein FWG99_02590 [Treponema sp.]|nr:hypothetical protein [Treponema sp.]
MKNLAKLAGSIALAAMIGFTITACDTGSGGGNETQLVYTALDTAIANANAAKAAVEVSVSGTGSEFAPAQKWVTQAALDALNAAITEAETVRSAATTQEQVDNAVTALNAAIAAFIPQDGTKPADTSDLQALIVQAETLKGSAVVSTDGSDVAPENFWVTQAEMAALNNAITAAETAVNSGSNIGEAYSALNAAMTAFTTAKKAGTQGGSGPGIVDKTALQNRYNELKDTTQGSYTDATWTAFQAKLTAAKNVLDNTNATQAQVNTALAELNTAYGALEELNLDPYIITGSGTSFTAVKNAQTIGTANSPIQTVINSIRGDAAGKDCAIQFGDNTSVLDVGTEYVNFNGGTGGTAWGKIMLSGKITSKTPWPFTTIHLENGASIISTADIEHTSGQSAIQNSSTGSVIISGGTVSSSYRTIWNNVNGAVTITGGTVESSGNQAAIYNFSTGPVTISGGIIRATGDNGRAVLDQSTGTVTISGGTLLTTAGNSWAVVSLGTLNISGGTIRATGDWSTAVPNIGGALTITGGTIEVTGYASTAVSNADECTTTITDGTIRATGGNNRAVLNQGNGAVTITGGTIEAAGDDGIAIQNNMTGSITITDGTIRATGTGGRSVVNAGTGSISVTSPPAVIEPPYVP